MSDALDRLERGLDNVAAAWSPGQRRARTTAMLRDAMACAEARDALTAKLDRQWEWLWANMVKPTNNEGQETPLFREREERFFGNLRHYERLCDALRIAERVLSDAA